MTPGYVVTVTRPRAYALDHERGEYVVSPDGIGWPNEKDARLRCEDGPHVSRQTVDTLKQARGAVIARLTAAGAESEIGRLLEMVDLMSESCELPLPDGSSISVERVEDGGDR